MIVARRLIALLAILAFVVLSCQAATDVKTRVEQAREQTRAAILKNLLQAQERMNVANQQWQAFVNNKMQTMIDKHQPRTTPNVQPIPQMVPVVPVVPMPQMPTLDQLVQA